MSRNPDNFHFDIPIPIIVLAYCFSPPIGVVLTILRAISIPDTRKKVKNAVKEAGELFDEAAVMRKEEKQGRQQNYSRTAESEKNAKKRKKGPSAGVVLSTISCILFFIIGILTLLSAFPLFQGEGCRV